MSEAVANAAPANEATPAAAAQAKATEPALASTEVETKDTASADKNVVPEKYDLKAPEGSLLSPAQLEALALYSKENKLTTAQAEGLVAREHGAIATYVENQKAELETKSAAWKLEASTDKEIGGAEFEKNSEAAKRVLAKFSNPVVNKMLDDSGLGNHPEVLRLFVNLGKAMSDDSLILGGKPPQGEKRVADLFYPQKAAE